VLSGGRKRSWRPAHERKHHPRCGRGARQEMSPSRMEGTYPRLGREPWQRTTLYRARQNGRVTASLAALPLRPVVQTPPRRNLNTCLAPCALPLKHGAPGSQNFTSTEIASCATDDKGSDVTMQQSPDYRRSCVCRWAIARTLCGPSSAGPMKIQSV